MKHPVVAQVGVTPDNFGSLFADLDVRFVVPLSDHENVVPLADHGHRKTLTFDNAKAFAKQLLEIRLSESANAARALKAGFEAVVPKRVLALFTPDELIAALEARATTDHPPA